MKRRGLSLSEILVAGVVFSGMLVCIVLTLVSYLRASRELMPGRFTTRSLAGGMQWLVREASSLTTVYAPDQATLIRGFTLDETHPLVFARRGVEGTELVGVLLNPAKQRLERLVFAAPTFDPQHLPEQRQPVGDAATAWVALDPGDPRLTIRLTPPSGLPFQTSLPLSPEVHW